MIGKTVLSFTAALLLTGVTQGTRRPDTAELDRLIRGAVDSGQVAPVVAMVATRDGVVYEGAAGLPKDAIFAIASMTKPITTVAVMQLVETGKVRLEEPAHTYVPVLRGVQVLEHGSLRPPKSPPTVRHLLAHTSGFAYEFFNKEIADQVRAGKIVSGMTGTDEFLRAPLVSDPGVRWEYGISTDWLGRLVESVTGQSLDAYLRANIFTPLGMTDTYFDVPVDKRRRVAPRFFRGPDGKLAPAPSEPVRPVKFFSGGGGLLATAGDYLKFARALLAGGELGGRRILKDETVALLPRNQIKEPTLPQIRALDAQFVAPNAVIPGGLDGFGLGFGVNRKPLPSGRGAGTMSWAGIFNTFFWIDREKGVCAVLLTQMLPFGDAAVLKLVEDFDRAVYRMSR